jgi:hypothetical protein
MSASRIDEQPIVIRKFDVVGNDSASQSHFIGHVGLAAEECICRGFPIDLIHMAPPMGRDAVSGPTCHGAIALTVDEMLQIQVFVDELISEYQAARVDSRNQYVIAPHVRETSAADGTLVCRRFSCGGFVVEAYRSIDVDFVDTSPTGLPPVSLSTLKTVYPETARVLDNSRLREGFGIPGDGPWPILLPGYLLNALDRSEADARSRPWKASPGDEFFPARRPGGERAGEGV